MSPVSLSTAEADVYPSGTLTSTALYAIASPFAFTGSLSNVTVQLLASLNSAVFPSTVFPSAVSWTSIFSVLSPSWLLLSFHSFFTVTSFTAGVWLLVIVMSPVFSSTAGVDVYPFGTLTSATLYTTSSPPLYFGRSVKVCDHWLLAFSSTASPYSSIPALSCTVTLSGLIPS